MTDTVTLSLDPDDMTIGEVETFEEIAGQTLMSAFAKDGNVSGKAMKALVYLALKRDNPNATVEDAANVKFGELLLGLNGDDVDPTQSAAAGDVTDI